MDAKLQVYEDKDGYRIRATEKAYDLYYRRQGFRPVSAEIAEAATQDAGDQGSTDFAKMTTAALKAYLADAGILFDSKAKKAELVKLAEESAADTGIEADTLGDTGETEQE